MNFTVKKTFLYTGKWLLLLAFFTVSCSEQRRTRVRNYPANTPFVYANKINLSGNLPKDEKKRLLTELINYWDDSLKVPKQQEFGILYKIKSPPAFDSTNILRSINFMNAYLNSQGYYYSLLSNRYSIDTVKDQIRVYVSIQIDPGKNISIDTVTYDLTDTTLKKITLASVKNAVIEEGKPYSKQVISNELDRLVKLYRRNGFYKFTREDIFAYVDSNNSKFLKLTVDPFEQARLLGEIAKAKKLNPKWGISIQQRPILDSSRLFQFHIGNLYYYPETKLSDLPDSLIQDKNFKETKNGASIMRY
ncbi:MAG: hypothetical protein EAZ41_02800, partial [Sphingobacteriia bacterium]